MVSENASGDDGPAVTVVSQTETTVDGSNVATEPWSARNMAATTPPVSSSNLQKLSVSEPPQNTVAISSNGCNGHESHPVIVQSPASDLTRSTPGVSPTVPTAQVVIPGGPFPPGVHQPKLGDGGPLAGMGSDRALETVRGTRIVTIAANEAASQPVKKTKGRFKVLDAPILQTQQQQQQNGNVVSSAGVASPLPPKKPQSLGERSVSAVSIPGKPSQSNLSERSLSSGHSSSGGSPQGNQNGTAAPQPPPIVKKKGRFVVMSAEAGDAKALARQASQLQVQSVGGAEPSPSACQVQNQVGAPSTEQNPAQQQSPHPHLLQPGNGPTHASVPQVVVQSAAIIPPAAAHGSGVDGKSPTQTGPAQVTRATTNQDQSRTVTTTSNGPQAATTPSHELQQQPAAAKGSLSATASPITVSVEPKLPLTVPPRPPPASAKPPSAFDSKGVGSALGLGKVFYFLDQMKQEVTEADRTIKSMHAEAKHLKERNKQLEAKVREMEKKWNEEKSLREAADTRVRALKKKLRELKAAAGDGSSGAIAPCEAPIAVSLPHMAPSANQERSRSRSSSIGYTDESVAGASDSRVDSTIAVNGKMTLDPSVITPKTGVKTGTGNSATRTNGEPDTPLRKPASSDGYQSAGEARKSAIDKESPSRNQRRETDPEGLNGAGPSMVDSFDPLKNTQRLASSVDSIDAANSTMNSAMNLRPRPQQNGVPVVMAPNQAMMVNGADVGASGVNGVGMSMGGFNMSSMQQQPQANMMMNLPHQMGLALQQQMMQQAAVAMGQLQPMANNGQQAGPQQGATNWAPYSMTSGQAGNQFPNAQAFVQQMQMNGGNGHTMNGNGQQAMQMNSGGGHAMNGNGQQAIQMNGGGGHAMNGNGQQAIQMNGGGGHAMNGNGQQTMQMNGSSGGHGMNGNGQQTIKMNGGNGHAMNGSGHLKSGPHQQQQQSAGNVPFNMLAWRGAGVPTQPQQTQWTPGQGLT